MTPRRFTDSVVEDAALEWLAALGYAVLHGPEIAPGEVYAERKDFREAVLDRRLGEALRAAQPGAARLALGEISLEQARGLKPGLVRT